LLPRTLVRIGSDCFADLGVRELDLSMTEIEELGLCALHHAAALERVTPPRTLRRIGALCFACGGVKVLDLSRMEMEELGEWAFGAAVGLGTLLPPRGLKRISSDLFFRLWFAGT
jgi:hypothetical protein